MKRIRVLVADDSALMRQTLKRIIAASADLDLVGLARDGEDAVAKARELRPDVVSMDINMPKLDGITALQLILQEKISPVVMVSSLTQQGTATTFECLELGAFDFVGKPDGTVSNNMGLVADELIAKLKAAASRGIVDRLQRSRERRKPYQPPTRATFENVTRKRAVVIGISTGGPATLQEVLPQIPADVPASLFLVQHMPPAFIASFAKRLDDHCALKIVEGRSGLAVEPSVCYVAPGGMHLCLHRKMTGEVVRSNVRNLHGTIEIRSSLGLGTTFRIKLPTSLMISKGILLEVGAQRYILPLSNIRDMVKLPAEEAHECQGLTLAQVRGNIYPIFNLAEMLGIVPATTTELSVAIVEAGTVKYGLVVDRFLTEVEVLVKPLTGGLEDCKEFQGAAIMGDGQVVLVLNALECHTLDRTACS